MFFSKIGSIFNKKKTQKFEISNASFAFGGNQGQDKDGLKDASFLSYHTNLNQSFRESDLVQTMNSESEGISGFSSINQNFTSIMNVPKKNHFVREFYNIMQETLTERKEIANSPIIQNIQFNDFNLYIRNIRNAFDFYQKFNRIREAQKQEGPNVNLAKSLVSCYENVPANYFDEGYAFDILFLSRDKKKMNKIQDDLSEYLDDIEVNLYYLVTNRFNDFLDVILDLNKMETEIESCIENINQLRYSQRNMNTDLISHSLKIIELKRKSINMQKTLHIMELLQIVNMTIPTLKKLIDICDFEYSVKLLKSSQSITQTKLKSIASIKNSENIFKEAKGILEKGLSNEFMQTSITYLQQTLAYNKHNLSSSSHDASMLEESFMNPTNADTNDSFMHNFTNVDETKGNILIWNLAEKQPNLQTEESISNIILLQLRVGVVSFRNYKVKILEGLKQFHKQFILDLIEYQENFQTKQEDSDKMGSILPDLKKMPASKNSAELTEVLQQMDFNLYIKFIFFYFQVYKRLIERQVSINKSAIMKILKTYDYSPDTSDSEEKVGELEEINQRISSSSYQASPARKAFVSATPSVRFSGEDIEDLNNLKLVTETVEDLYSIIGMLTKFMSDKITEFLGLKKSQEMNLLHFREFDNVFEVIKDYTDKELRNALTISYEKKEIKEGIKSILSKIPGFASKISINSLITLRLENQKNFINFYHKTKSSLLKQSLERESWTPADIPYNYLTIITFISKYCDANTQFESQDETEGALMSSRSSSRFNTGRSNYGEESSRASAREMSQREGNETEEDAGMMSSNRMESECEPKMVKFGKISLKLMRDELYINEERYKLTSSALLLLKILYDYLYISESFRLISSETGSKIFEIIKFYNSYTCQLILGAGAIHFDQIKTITARIMGVCSLSISFLESILDKIGERLLNTVNIKKAWIDEEISKLRNDLNNHNSEIFNKITFILNERLLQNCKQLDELEWGNPAQKIIIPTKFTAQIIANTKQMYSTCEDSFLSSDLLRIFDAIFDDIIEHYLKFFKKLHVNGKFAAQRVKDELEYFYKSITELKILMDMEEKQTVMEEIILKIIKDNCECYLQGTNLN